MLRRLQQLLSLSYVRRLSAAMLMTAPATLLREHLLALSAAGGGQQRSPTAATAATSPPRVGPGACVHVQPGALLPACASQSRRSPSRLRERLTPPAARGPAPAAARSGSAQPPARPVRPARLSPDRKSVV